ncbi:hydroxymethylpyrimidine kinase /phosphomethylpyrimidine kinase [Luteococcus japonicus]|uniref:Hydroxymethylpyrimidine kinase /phosphomethylpyrimidine kinase n=1 Tax=Luteococcus japonicus TaxID=33984 RepID=A0A3N1ZVE5_9ACTN|nr:bifunctional hydroxymethylpyrimidine kinase/phosphomethylpyrimidine kinase [Luteococcus japonicus]ROR54437.1 hydroxymethylpyrimidine kinase /phosphomethylpyrimidine kinase [Luteococcus japonicus]
MIPKVLTIAGVDPSGGAGIFADLKAFSALGGYGMGVVCALTAQSTTGVTGVSGVEPGFVWQQWQTLADDILPDAIKIGMLGSSPVAEVVGRIIDDYHVRGGEHVVLDPVMVATSGDRLLDREAEAAVRALVPKASLITPNLPEAAVLLGVDEVTEASAMAGQAKALLELGAQRVLLKAGHLAGGEMVDIYADAQGVAELAAPRVETVNTHGTGCTLSSAIATLRPQRDGWLEAVSDAKTWLTHALEHADELHVGHGHGPVHHFWNLWED